jgi:GT2 family glycosyltransferase
MEEVEVSIVIINYNTFHLTMDCIQSIYSIATGLHYEIILVDNNSSDFDVLNFKTRFPQAKLIQSPTNVGFAKGTNLGISVANGEYILLLNSDTLLKNDVPKILHSFLVLHPRVAAVSGRLEYPDGKVQHNCQRFPSIKYQLFELLRLQKLLPKKWGGRILFGSFFDYESVAYPDWIWGTCFMFRKKLLDELPNSKLADDFFMYGEDTK